MNSRTNVIILLLGLVAGGLGAGTRGASAQDAPTGPAAHTIEVELVAGGSIRSERVIFDNGSFKLLVGGSEQTLPAARIRYFSVDNTDFGRSLDSLRQENAGLVSRVQDLQAQKEKADERYARDKAAVERIVAGERDLKDALRVAGEKLAAQSAKAEQLEVDLTAERALVENLKAEIEKRGQPTTAILREEDCVVEDVAWERSESLTGILRVWGGVALRGEQSFEAVVLELSAWDADGKPVGSVGRTFVEAFVPGRKRAFEAELAAPIDSVKTVRVEVVKAIPPSGN
jgi:hypothetical protein